MKTGRSKFESNKRLITVIVKLFSLLGKPVNKRLMIFCRNWNGNIGILLRFIILKNLAKNCGKNVVIFPNVFFAHLDKISFGSNVSIHPMTYIDGCGEVTIGDDVSIAHNCSILSTNHQWDDYSVPIKYNKLIKKSVLIKNDVWLGCGVRILAGVTVESRVVIAAGAVVSKNVPGNMIVGGVPAKMIKKILN